METRAKVIDPKHMLYGRLCLVGPLVSGSDVHRITSLDKPWHGGYARDDQLHYEHNTALLIDAQVVSSTQAVEIHEGGIVWLHDNGTFQDIELDAKAASKLFDFLLLHQDRIHRAAHQEEKKHE